MPSTVVLYATPTCPDCHAIRTWLRKRGILYQERDLTDPAVADEAKTRYGVRIAPITIIGEQFFSGTFEQQRSHLEALVG